MAALVRTELRQLQYAEDARQVVVCDPGVGQATRFTREMDQVDLAPIVESMPADGTTALLCVERDPKACHRSLVAERIAAEFGLALRHLTP